MQSRPRIAGLQQHCQNQRQVRSSESERRTPPLAASCQKCLLWISQSQNWCWQRNEKSRGDLTEVLTTGVRASLGRVSARCSRAWFAWRHHSAVAGGQLQAAGQKTGLLLCRSSCQSVCPRRVLFSAVTALIRAEKSTSLGRFFGAARSAHAVSIAAAPSNPNSLIDCWRIRNFCTLPVTVRGKLSTNLI